MMSQVGTYKPAPAIVPVLTASKSAASSTMGPLDVFIRKPREPNALSSLAPTIPLVRSLNLR